MNRHLHRIVFNAARGMRMVVQETASSTGKGASKATTVASGAMAGAAALAPMLIGAALAGMLSATSAHAQIVGAPNVPGNLRPAVMVAPNGVPYVNIQTPSAAGVSRNVYNQFNIGTNGAILNNSRTAAQSQLGGYIQGNPFLATGPARIIVNEVNGGNPSQLRGYLEVAGQRAEIIIANPAGISVDGGGFINASKATLTTGTPQFNAIGGLDSFIVRGGTVTIDGAGLDARTTDYAAILARAVQLNAAIYATDLKVVTGANQISADHTQITPTTGTGAAPTFTLDVAALGGMFANHIFLIGNEAGLGVRNAGNIGASNGNLIVTAAGRLENTGTLEGTRVELASAGDIDNRNGTIRQTSSVGLTVTAPVLSNTNAGIIGAEPLPATTAGTGASGGTSTGGSTGTSTPPASTPTAGTGTTSGGSGTTSPAPAPFVPTSPGTITAAGTLLNDGGRIYSGGPILLQTPQINNAGGVLTVASMAVSGPNFSNAGGTLNVSQSFSANVGTFDNTGGKVNVGSLNATTAGDLLNVDGTLASASDVNLSVGSKIDNTRGTISAAGALTAMVAGATTNSAGTLVANQMLTLNTSSLENTKGGIQSVQAGVQLAVANQLVNGSSGAVGAATDLNIQAGSLNNAGSLRGTRDATVSVTGAASNSGSITAGRNASITANTLASSSTGVLGAGIQNDGSAGASGDLSITAGGALAAHGTNLAAGNATLQGSSVDLSSGNTSAANITATATQGNVSTNGATVATPGTLAITANAQPGQALVNQAGTLSAGQLAFNVANIDNSNKGQITQTGTAATGIAVSGTINNDTGTIASNGQDLSLQAASITNNGGQIEHAGTGTLSIAGGGFSGTNGTIAGNGALAVNVTGTFNQDGGTTSANQITVDAGSLSDRGGLIVQTGTGATRITVASALDSSGGLIASNGNTTVVASSVINQGGKLQAAGTSNLNLTVANQLDNSLAGQILAGGNATVQTGTLKNDAGSLTAVGDLGVTATGAATNVGGTLAANGNTTVTATSLDSTQGSVAAVKGNLAITTTGATTNSGGVMAAGGSTTLTNGGLINVAGSVSGNSLSVNTNNQQLVNTSGVLGATTSVNLQSGAIFNDAGLIQSGGAMTIDAHDQALRNTNAAGFASGQGGITSADTLTLTAGAVNNTGGYIGAKNALTANTQAFSNTAGGIVLGQSTVAIDTNGTNYDNSGGQTVAAGDLSINAVALQNTSGLIRSLGNTTLSAAGAVTNANTQAANQGIEGQNVAITAGSLDNSSGAVRANANTTITSPGSVNNSNGFVSALNVLRIVDTNDAGTTSTGAAKTLNLTNANGTLVANKGVDLRVGQASLDGKIQSGADLSIASTNDVGVAQGSVLAAIGNLTLNSGGNVTNAGTITSGNSTWVQGNNVDNTATGQITSLGTTTVIAQGSSTSTVTNRGLIDGTTTLVTGSTITNIGTGRIYGDQLSIQAGTLNNVAETVNGTTSAGTIAARQRLDLGVGTLNNSDGALILSLGDINIGGALDANGRATGQATAVNNHAATIQAQGQVNINTQTLANTNAGVTYTMVDSGTSTHVVQFALQTSPLQRYDAADVLLGVIDNPCAGLAFCNQKNSYGQDPTVWPSFKAVSGSDWGKTPYRDVIIPQLTGYPIDKFGAYYLNPPRHSADRGGDPGYYYPITDPIWAAFGVTPPAVELPAYLHGLTQNQVTVGNMESHFLANGTVKFDHPLTQAEYDALPAFNAAHEALDAQTSQFMAAIVGKPPSMNIQYLPGPGGLTNAYTYWDYTQTGSTPVLQSSAPGKILSGGAMNLNVGGGVNEMSQILAGGALTVRGGTIVNSGLTADAQLKQVGTTGTMVGAGDNAVPVVTPYNQTINTTVTLAAGVQQGNTAVGNGGSVAALGAGASAGAVAQGGGTLNANTRVSPIVQVPLAVTGSGNATGTQANAAGAANGATGTGTASGAAPTVVRTTTPNLGVPSASLFRTQPDAGSRYLIATDPAFAQYRVWLSSDYLLNNLGQDPNNTLKRLGDGFYEQQLIDQQVAKLTGSRYLDGYGDDQSEYTALMNSGATFAKQYNLTVGVALTDAQMAQLTSDIVWLVQQTVTLPDGSTQQVLVPQVYVRARPGDIDGSGALLAGKSVDLQISGDLLNINGTIAGRQAVNLNADNIANLGGRISGNSVTAKAGTDLSNIGGLIDGQNSVALSAQRDVVIASTTRTSTNAESGRSDTVLDRVAGVYVGGAGQAGATLSINAGRDLVLAGAIVSNQGSSTPDKKASTTLQAGRDIVLGTVTTASSESVQAGAYSRNESRQQQVGTQVVAVGDIQMQAGRDLSAQAVHIASSQGNVALEAKRDLTIVSGSQQTTFGNQLGDDKSQYYSKNQIQMDNAQASVVMGAGNVTLRSGGDMTIEGSVLAAGADAKTQQAINDATHPVDARRSGTGSVVAVGDDGALRLNRNNSNIAAGSTPAQGTLTLDAGGTINLLASNSDLSVGSKIEDGSSRNSKGDGSATVSNGTQLSGGTVNIQAKGDINSQASVVNATTLNVTTPGQLNLLTAKDNVSVSQSGIDNDAWFVTGGDSGQKNDITRYNQLNAKNINLNAGSINAQLGGFDTPGSLAQQPGMGWMNQLMNDPKYAGKVDWQRVKEVHEQWDNTYVALGPASQAVITVIVAFATAGAGAEAGASVGDAAAVGAGQGMTIEGATFLTNTGVTISAGVSNAVQVGIANLVSTASVSLINHDGDIGAVLKDLGSSASVKGLVTNMITAGVLGGLDASGILPPNIANATDGTASFANQLQRQLIDRTAGALIDTAINGGSLERNLQNALANAFLDTAAAQGATLIGANGPAYGNGNLNAFTAQVAHAILGCMVGAGRAGAGAGTNSGNGCSAGAIGAVVGDLAGQLYNPYDDPAYMWQAVRVAGLVAGIAGAIVGGDGASANIAAAAGSNAVANNQNAAVNLLNRMTPLIAEMSEGGIQALSADALATVQSCLKFTWCSAIVPAAAVGWFAINNPPKPAEPTGAGQIPNEYAPPYRPIGGMTTTPGTALNQPSSTTSPASSPNQSSTTTTSGTALPGVGTPGYSGADPTGGNTSTTSPSTDPVMDPLTISQNAQNGSGVAGAGSTVAAGAVAPKSTLTTASTQIVNDIGAQNVNVFSPAPLTRNSATQIVVDMTQSNAIANLQANGYSTSYGGNGAVTMLTKDGVTYTFYGASSGNGVAGAPSGIPSASVTVNGQVTKIRFNPNSK